MSKRSTSRLIYIRVHETRNRGFEKIRMKRSRIRRSKHQPSHRHMLLEKTARSTGSTFPFARVVGTRIVVFPRSRFPIGRLCHKDGGRLLRRTFGIVRCARFTSGLERYRALWRICSLFERSEYPDVVIDGMGGFGRNFLILQGHIKLNAIAINKGLTLGFFIVGGDRV
jgi:hypothetical protein